jgi:hypothetical protein
MSTFKTKDCKSRRQGCHRHQASRGALQVLRSVAIVTVLASVAAFVPVGNASAKSTGTCPPDGDWRLVAVADLSLMPGLNLASVDGNGDGLTCIKPWPPSPSSGLIIRDNTVGA